MAHAIAHFFHDFKKLASKKGDCSISNVNTALRLLVIMNELRQLQLVT